MHSSALPTILYHYEDTLAEEAESSSKGRHAPTRQAGLSELLCVVGRLLLRKVRSPCAPRRRGQRTRARRARGARGHARGGVATQLTRALAPPRPLSTHAPASAARHTVPVTLCPSLRLKVLTSYQTSLEEEQNQQLLVRLVLSHFQAQTLERHAAQCAESLLEGIEVTAPKALPRLACIPATRHRDARDGARGRPGHTRARPCRCACRTLVLSHQLLGSLLLSTPHSMVHPHSSS